MKKWLLLTLTAVIALLLLPAKLSAQSTSVTGNVTDAGGQAWANGTYSFTFVGPPNAKWPGGNISPVISGNLDSSGNFTSVAVPDNNTITPPYTQWTLKVCPNVNVSTTYCFQYTLTITGAAETITSLINPIAISIPASLSTAARPVNAYSDSEISGAVQGFQYYNISSSTYRFCQSISGGVCSWATGTGGGAGTVTSVALALPSVLFTISGSPVTGSGTLTGSFITNAPAYEIFGNCTASSATPNFCAITNAMLPTSGVTAGSYTNANITVNAQGIVTAAANGSAAGCSNALTMNNSGFGASSGATFNCSAPVTLSYNTLGASPLAGSTSLVTVGTIGTGTWGATAIAPQFGGTGQNWSSSGGIPEVISGTFSLYNTNCNTSGSSGLTWTVGTGIGCNTITGSMTWPSAAGITVYSGSSSWSPSLAPATGAIIGGVSSAWSVISGPTGPNSVAEFLCETPSGGAATAPTFCLPGNTPRAATSTSDTILATDRGGYISESNASAIAVTVPQAGTTGFANNFSFTTCDIGAGTATYTPTTSNISYSTGSSYTSAASSMALTTGQCAFVYTDNTNYFAIKYQASAGGGDTITSPNSTLVVGGTSTNTTLDLAGSAGEIMAGATPALTYTPTLGKSGTAGTLSMFPSSGNFTTTLGSAATASNTVDFFATVPTNLDMFYCVVASTTCTLTDAGYAYNAIPTTDISGLGTLATIATGTLTNGDYCTYSSTGPTIACNSTGGSGAALSAITSPTSTNAVNMAGFGWGLTANVAQTANMLSLTGFNGAEAFDGISIIQGGTSDTLTPMFLQLKNAASTGEIIEGASGQSGNIISFENNSAQIQAAVDNNFNIEAASNFYCHNSGNCNITSQGTSSPIVLRTGGGPTNIFQAGSTTGGSNAAGSNSFLSADTSTGTGALAEAILYGSVKAASGATLQTQVNRYATNLRTTLTNNTATTILTAANASGSTAGVKISYCVHVDNGTDYQMSCGEVTIAVANKAGTTTTNVGTPGVTSQILTTGTLTLTWAASAANPSVISLNANSSLTPTTDDVTWSVENLGDANDITVTTN